MRDKWFEIRNETAPPVRAGELTVTPHSQAVIVRLPGDHGGLIWNRPTAVTVQHPEGRVERLPVIDVTRLVQIGLFVLVLLGGSLLKEKAK